MRVKICGITNKEDALMAANAGADAIGVINIEGTPRFVDLESAKKIFEAVPIFVTKVIVVMFLEEEIRDSERWLRRVRMLEETGADCLQLHGEEAIEFVRRLRKETRMGIIKKVAVDENSIKEALQYEKYVDAILLDTKVEGVAGGTGKTHDWSISLEIRRRLEKPIILAGGLTPENVASAIRIVKPYAVDVSSGVEKEVGKKDASKIKKFLEAAKGHIHLT
ncbi:MAG: phosphoribosylanthranilate isomerase [Candidatus Methanospirareceae archaeon]